MSKIDHLFDTLRQQERKAFMPFVTAGDPSLELTARAIETLADHGASMIEVGIPYSDPIADGPVIQASYTRALGRKIKVADIFRMLGEVSGRIDTPLVTMVSYAIVHRHGAERYIDQAIAAGVSGAIVPDLPTDESEALSELSRAKDFALIQLVTPTTPRERAKRIADTSTGFLYYVSVTGITGERTELPPDLVENVAWLKSQTDLPICIGFGISKPEHVELLGSVADGLIVGSAIVRILAEAGKSPDETLEQLGNYADQLVAPLAS